MKRLLSLAACFILALTLLSGCGAPAESSSLPAETEPTTEATTVQTETTTETTTTTEATTESNTISMDALSSSFLNGVSKKTNIYPNMKSVYFDYSEEEKTIILGMGLDERSDPNAAPVYAEKIINECNDYAQTQDSSIKGTSDGYYGGLFDEYNVVVKIFYEKDVEDVDKYIINFPIEKGVHASKPIEFNETYAASANPETTAKETTAAKANSTQQATTAKQTTAAQTTKATTAKPTTAIQTTKPTTQKQTTTTQKQTTTKITTTKKQAEQAPPNLSSKYVLNTNTGKFHYASCSSVRDMSAKNAAPCNSREEAISKGFVPCGRCEP